MKIKLHHKLFNYKDKSKSKSNNSKRNKNKDNKYYHANNQDEPVKVYYKHCKSHNLKQITNFFNKNHISYHLININSFPFIRQNLAYNGYTCFPIIQYHHYYLTAFNHQELKHFVKSHFKKEINNKQTNKHQSE